MTSSSSVSHCGTGCQRLCHECMTFRSLNQTVTFDIIQPGDLNYVRDIILPYCKNCRMEMMYYVDEKVLRPIICYGPAFSYKIQTMWEHSYFTICHPCLARHDQLFHQILLDNKF